jgi:hypothetical protein
MDESGGHSVIGGKSAPLAEGRKTYDYVERFSY